MPMPRVNAAVPRNLYALRARDARAADEIDFCTDRTLLEQSSNSATRPARRSARRELRYRRSRASARLRCSSLGIWPAALTVSTHFSRSIDWASTSAMPDKSYTVGQTLGGDCTSSRRPAPKCVVHDARLALREPQVRWRRQPVSQKGNNRSEVSQGKFQQWRSHGVAIPARWAGARGMKLHAVVTPPALTRHQPAVGVRQRLSMDSVDRRCRSRH